MRVVKIDKLTWEAVGSYATPAEAARKDGVSRSSMRNMLYKRVVPRGRWVYRLERDFDPSDGVPRGVNAPLDVTDTLDGSRFRVPSAGWLADRLGCSRHAVNDARCHGTRLLGRYEVRHAGKEGS